MCGDQRYLDVLSTEACILVAPVVDVNQLKACLSGLPATQEHHQIDPGVYYNWSNNSTYQRYQVCCNTRCSIINTRTSTTSQVSINCKNGISDLACRSWENYDHLVTAVGERERRAEERLGGQIPGTPLGTRYSCVV